MQDYLEQLMKEYTTPIMIRKGKVVISLLIGC